MNLRTLHARSLAFFARANAAVVLCVAVATAVLTGALLVGDSMRGSLRDMALRRLGPVDHALVAPRFFREQFAADIAQDAAFQSNFETACPALLLSAAVELPDAGARQSDVAILGVEERFWQMYGVKDPFQVPDAARPVVLNHQLADRLAAKRGDDVLIRLVKPADVPAETLLGRRDDSATTLRLTVVNIIENDGPGAFGLKPDQYHAQNAYVPLPMLQSALAQRERVNAILMTAKSGRTLLPREDQLNDLLARHLQLADAGLRLVSNAGQNYVALQSDRLLIEPATETAALAAARHLAGDGNGAAPAPGVLPVLAYLANTIERVDGNGEDSAAGEKRRSSQIPYSVVAALDIAENRQPAFQVPGESGQGGSDAAAGKSPGEGAAAEVNAAADSSVASVARPLRKHEIILNQWAADDLGAAVGDNIRLEFYVARPLGGLDTQSHTFRLAGIVPMEGWAADAGLMPDYRGITDADSLADWDPPDSFQLDLSRIRPRDEEYWKQHRGTPKAFVSLAAGQSLWTQTDARHGRLTSILFRPTLDTTAPAAAGDVAASKAGLDALRQRLEPAILRHLPPAALAMAIRPVREQALMAGAGSTDFAGLFIAFSFFLIAAAAMLVSLVFRLGVERRAREIGLLRAVGFSPGKVRRFWLTEGAVLALVGSLLGLAGALGYAWLMLAGLRSWWSDAVNAPFLDLYVAPMTLPIGLAAGFAVAMISIALALRGLARRSPRALLAGATSLDPLQPARGRAAAGLSPGTLARILAVLFFIAGVAAAVAPAVTNAIAPTSSFFAAGAALLVAGLAALSALMSRSNPRPVAAPHRFAMVRLGTRNARRQRGRSLLTAGLIASAAFVIVAVGASRHGADAGALAKDGGTGGYDLLAESVAPLHEDLSTPRGRSNVALTPETDALLKDATVMALRLLPGEDTSCLNLYQVSKPRLLGVPEAFIGRGGFAFAGMLADASPAERANPWVLLDRAFDDGAVPAIGDANTLMWLLKLAVGDDFMMIDERGNPLRLRIVAMLSGSMLQGELVICERDFTRHFPSVAGYNVLLIDGADANATELARSMEKDLSRYGMDVEQGIDRLNEYRAVENTYMSTFQTLGGLGLLLGTVGLAAVMLRNIQERRGELALLRAVGYSRGALGWMVSAENAGLLIAGLAIGTVSALVAVAPHAVRRPGDIDWASLAIILAAILVAGLVSGGLALRSALRTPLLPALRRE